MKKLFTENKKMKGFLIVFFAYAIFLLLLILLIDSIIFPSITTDKDIVNVPNIQGKSLSEAKRLLNTSNLELEITKEIYSEKNKIGNIVSQKPLPNSKVKSGRAIFVTTSKGKELVQVPYLVGLQLRSARINLMKSGFELGTISYNFDDNIPKDAIISQSKQAGSRVPYGEKINITISKGTENQIKVPNIVGMSLSEAIATIKESGFSLGIINRKFDETYLPDIVIQQSPLAGETAVGETSINITITE